jgi:hypothetical protein
VSGRRTGRANAEFVLYMTLLLVLGLLVFSFAAAGSGAYSKLVDRKDRDARLRVAVSFLEVQIRRHDAAGAVRLGANPFGPGTALFLTDESGGDVYETVVFCKDGSLRELLALQGAERSADQASEVAGIESLRLSRDGDRILIEATAADGTVLASSVFLRSGGEAAP